jgi:hypothetical protein
MNARRLAYGVGLLAVSLWVLAIFVRPVEGVHSGLNQYYRSKFLDMVNGTAYKPFVYRTLLPTTIHIITAVTPPGVKESLSGWIWQHDGPRGIFEALVWEPAAAYEYLAASLLLLACFAGFAHTAAHYTLYLYKLQDTPLRRFLLAAGALLGLPAFFRYTSFPYDPAQLFLFTLALYALATGRLRVFFVAFVFCCFNKETAVLLIPLFALAGRQYCASPRQFGGWLAGLIAIYLGVKGLITLVFWHNPGSFVEFQLAHNLDLFTRGWNFSGLLTFGLIAGLLFYRWPEKPLFLRQALLCTLLPLMALALFLGYFDEWRGYYEAYPTAFALGVDTVVRFIHNSRYSGNTIAGKRAG